MDLQTQENFRPPESENMAAEMQRTMTSLTRDQLKAVKMLAAELDVPVSVVMRALITHSLDLLGASDAGIRRALDAAVSAERDRRSEIGRQGMAARWGEKP
ncbi:hypothetical protein QP932_10675 [Corynebacterium freneyi]|uniref:hypothetical protein n=1 Tax=Corynebacterium freneyi TaxID=134034 RepID=UPI0025506EED|nr:hypothetical protein [Corynebacterium freneyi]MDK8768955.1 hypothetical protein [Corynebacterium freneyi]